MNRSYPRDAPTVAVPVVRPLVHELVYRPAARHAASPAVRVKDRTARAVGLGMLAALALAAGAAVILWVVAWFPGLLMVGAR
jgi:hypothetical protein